VRLSSHLRDWPGLAVYGLASYANFSSKDPLSRICHRLFPVAKIRTDRTSHIAVHVDPSDASHMMIFDEVLIENVYELERLHFPPELIIDCGGHIGLFTARAAGFYPSAKMITFEPMPKNFKMIQAMVEYNRLKIEIRQEAVSDRDTSATFYERVSFGGSMDKQAFDGITNSYEVKVTNLIDVVRQNAPRSLLLKMDIEGEEENLLPKLIPELPHQCAVFFETHTADKGWDAISTAFDRAGFAVHLIRARDQFRDGLATRG
jgi:FkbM family methyltransferase